MRFIARILTSRISNKIILPYLLLALLLTIAVTFVAVRLTAGALQDRLTNRLIEAGLTTSDGLVAVEELHLEQLRAMVFTEGVAEALAAGDHEQLETLLRPHWGNSGLWALVVFDTHGQPIISWQRPKGASVAEPPQPLLAPDLSAWWIVRQIVEQQRDEYGDKFSTFHGNYLYTAAPVRRNGALMGGIMVGLPIDEVLQQLQARSQASVTTFYDSTGQAFATTQIVAGDAVVPAVPARALAQLGRAQPTADAPHVQDVVTINGRDYQFAYSPLRLRRALDGYFSVGLSRGFVLDTWSQQRWLLMSLALLMLVAVIGLGMLVARRITRPLQDLVDTARAVTNGELRRRSAVRTHDELGVVARSFNRMTERLLHLYETSRNLNAQTEISTIVAQVHAATQPLVPGACVLVLLDQGDDWLCYIHECANDAFSSFRQRRFTDRTGLLTLCNRAAQPLVAPTDARRVRVLNLPETLAEVCYMALNVQGQAIGLLVVGHTQRGMFPESVLEPLATVASMAATSLHNTRLYLAVQEEGNRRQAILESIADGVLVCDAERNVVLMNPAAEVLLEVRDWAQRRYRVEDLPLEPVGDDPFLATNERVNARYMAHGRVLRASSATIPAAQGFAGEVIVLHNISEEAALDQAKTDLIAVISHELRTPLTSIRGAVDMLCQGIGGELVPLQMELARMALRQTHAMSTLIDKAIMFANIETGRLDLDLQPAELRPLVQAAVDSLRSTAEAAEVQLVTQIPNNLPAVLVDAQMVTVALQQVIDNAIKYGGAGTVHIVARTYRGGVALAVRDYGPGIPAERLARLFEPLQRDAESLNAEPRGMGLGLVITRALIERQGGSIVCESKAGHGTLMSIFLKGAHDEAQSYVA